MIINIQFVVTQYDRKFSSSGNITFVFYQMYKSDSYTIVETILAHELCMLTAIITIVQC